jgi:hypothetical protein
MNTAAKEKLRRTRTEWERQSLELHVPARAFTWVNLRCLAFAMHDQRSSVIPDYTPRHWQSKSFLLLLGVTRDFYYKTCFSRFAFNRDVSVVRANQTLDNGESKAGRTSCSCP